jgi:hypothetical protein
LKHRMDPSIRIFVSSYDVAICIALATIVSLVKKDYFAKLMLSYYGRGPGTRS